VVDSKGIGGVETAEKNWVMMGWDGSVGLRVRLRDGGGWRRLRAAELGGERDVVGDGAAVGGGMRSRGSWLFHTSQCKALQVCSGRARELGTGSSAGSSS
jgi:hypothetical protein